MSKIENFKKSSKNIEMAIKPIQNMSNIYSLLRLGCVAGAIGIAIYADASKKSFGYIIACVFLLLFIALIIKHSKIKKELRYLQAKKEVYEHLLARCDDTWKQETCDLVVDKEDSVSIDLDILGDRSLYQYINMAATPFGKDMVCSYLQGKSKDHDAILKRQHAVKELIENPEVLIDIETSSHLFKEDCMKIKREVFDFLIDYGKKNGDTLPKGLQNISIAMVFLTMVLLGLAFFNLIPYGYGAVMLLINLIVSFLFSGKVSKELEFTKNLERILHDYQMMFDTCRNVEFKDAYLCDIQNRMKLGIQGIRKLMKVMNLLALRHNIIAYFIGAALCLLDFRCVHALDSWRAQYGKQIEDWLQSAGEMEALCSLSVIAQVKEEYCFPEILLTKKPVYQQVDGYHPLIKEDQVVANSSSFEAGSVIVTGSNMSGKTTFLRTLGINMVLMIAGAPVCAKQMQASVMKVYTSMRVRDDVSEGISTFYAELMRIRHMMEDSSQQDIMLVLVDEIFKGTNSADRVMCAKTAIERLHLPWIMTLVSTHDFELCELDKDPQINAQNFHFSEYYIGDEIHFDYTLKHGRCTTTNAQQLMKLAGF